MAGPRYGDTHNHVIKGSNAGAGDNSTEIAISNGPEEPVWA